MDPVVATEDPEIPGGKAPVMQPVMPESVVEEAHHESPDQDGGLLVPSRDRSRPHTTRTPLAGTKKGTAIRASGSS
jgi:hypothetical protein